MSENPTAALPTVTPMEHIDLHRVVASLPTDLIEAMKKSGYGNLGRIYVAGGFIRAIIAGEEPSDIDLWAAHPSSLNNVIYTLQNQRQASGDRCKTLKTDNAVTLLTHGRITIQAITRWTFLDAEALVNSFDYTICQAAVWWEAGAWWSCISARFYPDLAAKRLYYTHPMRVEEAGGSLLRAIKYIKRGYNIQMESLGGVVARIYTSLRPNGRDMTDEGTVATVVTGLLREVDPSIAVDGVSMVGERVDT